MSIVDQIGWYLAARMPDVNVSQGLMPAMPDRCLAVFGSGLNAGAEHGMRVQIRVRGDDSPGMALGDAETTAELLDDFEGLLHADGHYITRVLIESGPSHIGVDQNQRQEYSVNLRVFACP